MKIISIGGPHEGVPPLRCDDLKRALKDIKATNPLYVRSDGEAALEFLRDSANPKPFLILLDLNMPRMNGLEFLKIIKADDDWRKIPVVVLTTSQEEQDRLASTSIVLLYLIYLSHLIKMKNKGVNK